MDVIANGQSVDDDDELESDSINTESVLQSSRVDVLCDVKSGEMCSP